MCDRHPPFDLEQGDRAVLLKDGLAAAMNRANRIAGLSGRGRRHIAVHHGQWIDTYVIQSADRYAAWRLAHTVPGEHR